MIRSCDATMQHWAVLDNKEFAFTWAPTNISRVCHSQLYSKVSLHLHCAGVAQTPKAKDQPPSFFRAPSPGDQPSGSSGKAVSGSTAKQSSPSRASSPGIQAPGSPGKAVSGSTAMPSSPSPQPAGRPGKDTLGKTAKPSRSPSPEPGELAMAVTAVALPVFR